MDQEKSKPKIYSAEFRESSAKLAIGKTFRTGQHAPSGCEKISFHNFLPGGA
jgi:hypothetical protein